MEDTKPPCTLSDCTNLGWRRMGRGGQMLCAQHHNRWKKTGVVGGVVKQYVRGVKVCIHPECEKTDIKGLGYCGTHYKRLYKHGDPNKTNRLANGLRQSYIHQGYRYVRVHDHPNMGNNGFIREHVLVMSQTLARPLLPGENVHHKNGVKLDNRPENLELWVKSQPAGQRAEDLVAWAREILARYECTPAGIDASPRNNISVG